MGGGGNDSMAWASIVASLKLRALFASLIFKIDTKTTHKLKEDTF